MSCSLFFGVQTSSDGKQSPPSYTSYSLEVYIIRRVPVTNWHSDIPLEVKPELVVGNPGFQTKSNGFNEYSGARTSRFRSRSSRGITNGWQRVLRFDVEMAAKKETTTTIIIVARVLKNITFKYVHTPAVEINAMVTPRTDHDLDNLDPFSQTRTRCAQDLDPTDPTRRSMCRSCRSHRSHPANMSSSSRS